MRRSSRVIGPRRKRSNASRKSWVDLPVSPPETCMEAPPTSPEGQGDRKCAARRLFLSLPPNGEGGPPSVARRVGWGFAVTRVIKLPPTRPRYARPPSPLRGEGLESVVPAPPNLSRNDFNPGLSGGARSFMNAAHKTE